MDSLTNFDNGSRNLIDVSEHFELEYWCEKFRVSPERLKSAIKATCNCAADKVKAYLESNK